MEDLFHYTYYVKNGIKMHFLHSSVFDSQDSQEGSDKMKDIVFCSNNCFVLYSAAVQAKNSENKVSIKHWQTQVSWNYCSYLLENREGPRGSLHFIWEVYKLIGLYSDIEILKQQHELKIIFAELCVWQMHGRKAITFGSPPGLGRCSLKKWVIQVLWALKTTTVMFLRGIACIWIWLVQLKLQLWK